MTAWADHGEAGNGEPLAIVLRAGNAGSNTAADISRRPGSRSRSSRVSCAARSWSAPIPAAASSTHACSARAVRSGLVVRPVSW